MATAVLLQVCSVAPGTARGLTFSTAPALPTLPAVALNGRAQTTNTTMTSFAVSDLLKSSWNVTVAGNTATGDNPVFAQYCPNSGGCGADAFGYILGGKTLPAAFTCNTTPCNVDSATPSKIATVSGLSALATWTARGFSATSLALSTATTLKTLPASEVYRVDVVWTLNTGP